MKLLIIRHGRAEDRIAFARHGQNDDLRPLTDDGRKRLRRGLKGLKALVPQIDLLASSPLVRTKQTAEIIAEAYPEAAACEAIQLAPGALPETFAQWLRGHAGQEVVAVVGHEPDLSTLIGWLLTGREESFMQFKKGGACLLELRDEIGPATATLHWVMTPAQLRNQSK